MMTIIINVAEQQYSEPQSGMCGSAVYLLVATLHESWKMKQQNTLQDCQSTCKN